MSAYWEQAAREWRLSDASDQPNIDADNDVAAVWFWPHPVDIVRVGYIATTAVVNAAGTVEIELYRDNVVGSGADTLLGTWVSAGTVTLAAGQMAIGEVVAGDEDGELAEDGTTRYVGPTGPIRINPGQSFIMKVTEPADSGVVRGFVEYVSLPLVAGGSYVTRASEV